jgi:hypothetical protein
MDRIVLLGAAHGLVIDDLREITTSSTFLYDKEHALQNVLLEAFAEMSFVVHQFQTSHEHLLANGTPELAAYLKELNEVSETDHKDFVVELHAFELSTFFKSFLLLAKAVLDKVVPLYSYRFYDNQKQFSNKGARLIRSIRNNKNVGKKTELIALIEEAKREWIDGLIDLRDEYAHYSSLTEYRNFWIPGERTGQGTLTGIADFHRPVVIVNGHQLDALEYVLAVKTKLVAFLRDFLQLCEFTPGRRPKRYLECECGHLFAKRLRAGANRGRLLLTSVPLEIRVRNRVLDYGVITCPRCGGETDTDLQFWREKGFSFLDAQQGATGEAPPSARP